MTDDELLRRAEDLAMRASRRGELTHSTFLTPAECALLGRWRPAADCTVLLHGGVAGAERRAAFFPARLDGRGHVRPAGLSLRR